MRCFLLRLIATSLFALAAGAAAADDTAKARAEMVATIQEHARAAYGPGLAERISEPVAAVMGRVPRHEFVPAYLDQLAYGDRPLPIGYGQTISQPYIVALMSDLLDLKPGAKVLEIGTGSGYQAAVLAALGAETHSIEIIPELGASAAARLKRLGYDKVQVRVGDGYHGWPEAAPFDGILVTAAASHVPPPLVEQLKPGGRMVIPVGGRFTVQWLLLVAKQPDGAVTTRQLLPVRFVPLTGGH